MFFLDAPPLDDMDVAQKLDWLIEYSRNSTTVLRIYLVGLGFVAVIYVFYYFFEQKKPIKRLIFFGDEQYLEFCRLRRKVVSDLRNSQLTHEIYATSHCNLVGQLDLSDEAREEQLKGINREFFSLLSKKISETDEVSKLNLLLYYDWENLDSKEIAEQEWNFRIELLMSHGADTPTKFRPIKLRKKFLTDYFVIEDHTFITMRKPETNKAPVTCFYIKDEEFAKGYRSWLKNIIDSAGYTNDYCDERAISTELRKVSE
ncbi:MAG: hypothetical protein AAGF30_05155 [Pseudomonadota bacterium]